MRPEIHMSANLRRYACFGAAGFVLMGIYVFVTDGQKFGWANVDMALLLARGIGAGTFGLLTGLLIAWFTGRSISKRSE